MKFYSVLGKLLSRCFTAVVIGYDTIEKIFLSKNEAKNKK
jgi:hypothetical protein